jgi:hypothetical protein
LSDTVNIDSIKSRKATASVAAAQHHSLSAKLEWSMVATLAVLIVFGFGLRLSGIEKIGFAEDEINKVEAVRAYEKGDISPNAEHPMLMKLLMLASVKAVRVWNAQAIDAIEDETALRLPNIIFGALTVVPLFLLTGALFERRTALVAAALWAFGVNAVTYNRIAKEDTLLVFFMLFAFYFYIRAKQSSGFDAKSKLRFYGLSGASFGLMLASKYFPHYFGLNALYHRLFRVRKLEAGEPQWSIPVRYYIIMGVVFVLVNPAAFLPSTWTYLQAYSSEQLLTHTGYLMGEHLYKNNASGTPFRGTPVYFYALFMAIKIPLPVLAAFIIGLCACFKNWRAAGHGFLLLMFLLWIIPYSLFGAKWLRYALSLMPFVYMIAAVGITALINFFVALFQEATSQRVMRIATAAALVIFIALPAFEAYASGPHYGLYTNALGQGRVGYYFPHDEFYDDGVREALRFICDTAPQSAIVANETPGVARYYLEKFGRTDLQSRPLSDKNFNLADATAPTFVIVQRGRTYFENQEKLKDVRSNFQKIYDVNVEGANAAEVYAR